MEFWKRKKGTAGTAQHSSNSSGITPVRISEPIHNIEVGGQFRSANNSTPPPGLPIGGAFSGSPRSQGHAIGQYQQQPDGYNSGSDAEFRERYNSYRRQRRLSHTNSSARSSQMTATSDGGPTPITADSMAPQQQGPAVGVFNRQWSNDSDSMQPSHRGISAMSNASPAGSSREHRNGVPERQLTPMSASYAGDEQLQQQGDMAKAGMPGPPRGSLRSTRSAAVGRGVPGGGAAAAAAPVGGEPQYGSQSMRGSSAASRPGPFMSTGSSMSVATTASISSTGSRRSGMTLGPASSGAGELETENISEEEINLMLGRLMDEMDIKDAQRLQMQKMSIPNKLKLLKQQRQLESFQMDSKGNAPEYFYRYLTETDIRSLPKQMLVHLRVCVSTQPVNWVKQFVEMQGLEALSECLGILNHAGMRKGDDITKEIEIIKCIKSVVNIQWGAQDVLRYPTCVHNLSFSIDAPSLLTRRLISEILTYICYLNVPTGHSTVLKGLDKLQKFREMQKRFEPWMRALEAAVDGRGRMGSKVGASEELRQLGGTADRDLTDYVLSSMIFINAVVGVSDDVEMRMHYRNQLNVAGLSRIMKKLRSGFDSPLIALQINKFDKDAEQDHADVLDLYNQQIMQDMTDPEEVFQAILAQIDDDDQAREHFLSILQRLLLLRDDYADATATGMEERSNRANKARYYQLLDEITTQVVMDIRNGEPIDSDFDSDVDDGSRPRTRPGDGFTTQYGVSVAGIIDKFSNEEQLEEAVREAKDLREQLEKVTRQKNELELEVSLKSEGLVGTLKTKIFALEDLLRMSRHTIEALQTQIKELRDQFTQKLAKQDSQLKQLYSALQDEAGEHDMLRRLKDDLTLENEVLRSGIALEVSKDNPDHVVVNHDLLLSEIERLKQQRPELNRMTEARQMLERILTEAGQGTSARKPGAGGSNVKSSTERKASTGVTAAKDGVQTALSDNGLPEGAKVGTVTMDSVMSTPARLADFASELERKLGGYKGRLGPKPPAESEAPAEAENAETAKDEQVQSKEEQTGSDATVDSKAPPAGSDANVGAAIETEAESSGAKAADDIPPAPPLPSSLGGSPTASAVSPAPPLPPSLDGAPAPPPAPPLPPSLDESSAPPPAPPLPSSLDGSSAPPPAPPLPPMAGAGTGAGAGAGGMPTADALAEKLRSMGSATSGSSAPPPAPPPPPAAPPFGARGAGGVPAPPMPTFLGTLRRKELQYVPKVKLKALQWDKLNEQNVEGSMWLKLEDRAGLEEKYVLDTLHKSGTFESLEKLFAAKQAVDIFALREKRRKERENKRMEEITVLDSKRSYDVNILLGMMKKLSFRDIRRGLLRMDTSVVTENVLKQLLTFVPTPEERGMLSAYQGRPDRKRLARAERFFMETMKIWRYEQRLRVTTTWAAWPETFRDLQNDIASVMTAAHAVATSRHFPQVLEVVLSIGNFMNGSGFRGGAFGFKIASLNRLMDTKAEDNKTTLLHFVAATVEESFPDALEFLEELKPVDSGCRVSYTEMRAELGDMRVRLAEAKRELELLREQREKELKEVAMENEKTTAAAPPVDATQDDAEKKEEGADAGDDSDSGSESSAGAVTSASDPHDRFLLTIRRFVVEAQEQYESLSSQFTAMEDAYTNSMLLYGEEPRGMAPEEFFGVFKTFTASFNQVHRDNIRERERKRAAEKRRKHIEMQIEQKRMAKQNRAARLATGASRIREQMEAAGGQDNSATAASVSGSDMGAVDENAAASGSAGNLGAENGAVDDLLKSLMAGTDLERVEATKRRRRRELMSIRRRSSVRRSIHRTSISIKALQMLRDIKEDEEDEPDSIGADELADENQRSIRAANRRSLLRRNPTASERMSTITEDDGTEAGNTASSYADFDLTELRAARRRQRLNDE
ncbi:hypothetical protein H4R20_000762 [Coemansia guatemalensis]|uniref:Uncharacterized protein n=1 Tax=Coemansia guatemalensis TaxID=2761395 RepID=A0A9W8I0V6_9FUNG|nr:hypothetical protein H4R20_000762 [Coemansia guatemalensis]